jgi:hypothetical protein
MEQEGGINQSAPGPEELKKGTEHTEGTTE